MEWFQPQPASIAPLAQLMFGLVITLYLLSLPKKSRDGWLITGHYLFFTALFAATFLNMATLGASWHPVVEEMQFLLLAALTVYNLWFGYQFRQNLFRRESRLVVGVIGVLYSLAILTGKAAIVWTFPLFLFSPFWIMVVFLRKAGRAAPASSPPAGLQSLWHPPSKESRVYRDFALCFLLYFLVNLDAALGHLGLISKWWYVHVQVLIFLYLTLQMLVYLRYAEEPTTFLAKLVGVFLCLTLALLGLLGFLLYGLETSGEEDQQELLTLSLLIPLATVVIVVGAPAFFRQNLLRPLRLVVEGVQRVNAGDLAVQVPVAARDEVGSLAESFNRMTASLRQYALHMDQLVSQRTGELQQKSRELEQQKKELQQTLAQLEAAQAQLLASDAQKTKFFDNLTHEFRTPLTLILAPAERLLHRHEGEPDTRRDLETVERNARQLLYLINQLLELAKLEAGPVPVEARPGDVGALVAGIVEDFRPLAEKSGISLLFEKQAEGLHVFDFQKVGQIGYNLVANALKFTPAGGQVQVSVAPVLASVDGESSPKEAGVEVKISDTGMGIPPDQLPFIFDRFYQAHSSSPFTHPGTGIGLALVKEYAELLGGKISVESQVGQGTTFTVVLPLPAVEREEQTAQTELPWGILPPAPAHPGAGHLPVPAGAPLVLVVEDNTELREFLANELANRYRVLTAGNGREGVELARQELPDVVVSDVMMPELDGYALCQALKSSPHTSHIAVILLTARASNERMMEGLAQGADAYLTKPFHLEELWLRLRTLLERQQKLREFYQRHFSLPPGEPSEKTGHEVFLQKVNKLMEKHLDNPGFGPEWLAQETNMTVRSLGRKLNSLTGTSPARLIRSFRLQKAAELLRAGHSVADTAYKVGFESPSYFATAFKEFHHQTPSEFVAASSVAAPPKNNNKPSPWNNSTGFSCLL